MSEAVERESMEFDLVIVGGGPAGLSAAIRAKQLANEAGEELEVVVLEKGGEIGAHILSGVVVDPSGLDALIPDWRERDDAPLKTEVTGDKFIWLGPKGSMDISWLPMPGYMKNHGNYTGSLANVTRWLGQEAENLGINVFPGFAASDIVYGDNGEVKGVVAGVMGIAADGSHKPDYEPGMELLGKYVFFAEGARGSLSKQLIQKFDLSKDRDPQKYGIGLKELWSVPEENFQEGYVQHTLGWPLDDKTGGGSFLYHFRDGGEPFVSLGFVVHLNYKNPYLSPYQELQRWKHHPDILKFIEGGKRVGYGARAITEGGYQSLPKLTFPGGALIGCSAGFVNVPRIKGSHNAILTGMMGAEAAFAAIKEGRQGDELTAYQEAYEKSSVRKELFAVRNVKPLLSKAGTMFGTLLGGLEMWTTKLLGGFSFFGTLSHGKTDAAALEPASKHKPIDYPRPDGKISFDKLTNVSFTNTNHAEDQPVHLIVKDMELQKKSEHDVYAGPSARYCPAGVYEWVEEEGKEPRFQINAQNCIHCKTCDIKDPNQNINWTTPEGGGGPAYPNM
ncbi:MAG: electron transfer flavoprotein-ubiquinone oxidoreductase [Henriciella sp.]|jgi:electron-transferring-flavoprotein dehydrogenase|uniref:electron transfer flavoprotein-ubiquinone oxidoreductase n=1 Tax=Henriciella sp. TaxID=1968823 RepID=UPI000C106973|nr:electron transfer flavoprotein-ubiquinone oxidoreductase [Henriciella sp.]MAN72680.1 electron transfer flavoprotein-ubiquinone oxidoreductase [Henriciella sp.]PHR80026.1 MAG: electron transfer flavoprotein-ubiquinone oxidoreductase [Henriciella sp.]|tara:strand:+ start:3449 stop:5131 length:1683 start_codon:yes stop_codon:yes gene_type:complete